VSLGGTWQRYVLGAAVDTVEVPSSLRPSGYYQLRRSFVIPKPGPAQRVIAHFDAVNFHGRVFVNKTEAGTTLPYVPAEFDITKLVREGTNTMEVAIADLCAEPGGAGADEVWLGVNPGWEAYGGIIRPTYVELRPAAFVDNVRTGIPEAGGYAHLVGAMGYPGMNWAVLVRVPRAELAAAAVPLLPHARQAAERGAIPGGTTRNVAGVADAVTYADGVDGTTRVLLADAQTSGGLLIAVAPERADALVAALGREGTLAAAVIGRVVAGEAGRIAVR